MKKLFIYQWRIVLALVVGASASMGFAQSSRHGPVDSNAPAPDFAYESAFSDYQAFGEQAPADWKQINEEVGGAMHGAASSDTHAVVQSINRAENKVKLKHGPIPKLDMPGMTMVFRVVDAKLLDQVKEGDEVGVTVEKAGGGYVVTGFQKEKFHENK
ncbi:MAG TPA: copper-binding protein [Burkholderiales bacterium]|jgi:Cu/Ag efflux protein CusF|nr:copper-binding protein [Burkholderiales bacterium]